MSVHENYFMFEEAEGDEINEELEEVGISEGLENHQEAAKQQEVKAKRVHRPQPKLNADRLKGPRGIQTIEGIFQKIKFKGHGHEEEDLKTLLKGYQYWCHRLFPKFQFEDCIDKIERLGSKKEVQTHLKKIRMNMLILDEPVLNDDVNHPMLNEDGNDIPIEDDEKNLEPEEDLFNVLLSTPSQETTGHSMNSQQYELSAEQLESIRINRERALQRRIEKIQSKEMETIVIANNEISDIISEPFANEHTVR
ncbi:hypothetical protein FQA39_LY13198 [Lamprigera yunnana]|nr:hypothetical protein FQA39_LY13198 [Lamprigera yunnana]